MSIPVCSGPGTADEGWGHRLSKETQDALQAVSYAGQTVLVTGTTNGLGKAVSRKLLLREVSRLIMGVRNVGKGEQLKTQLLQDPEVKAAAANSQVDVFELDMEKYDSVQAFAAEVQKTSDRLDVAIMNAGTGSLEWHVSPTGHERMLQVDYLSTTYLALKLVPLLENTARKTGNPGRLVMVGSWTQFRSAIPDAMPFKNGLISHYDDPSKFDGATRYPDTQLLNSFFVKEIASRVDRSLLCVVEPTPPWTRTNWGTNYPEGPMRDYAYQMMEERGLPVDESADTYMYALHVARDAHGQFLDDNTIVPRNPVVESPEGQELQKSLWQEIVGEFSKFDKQFQELSFVK